MKKVFWLVWNERGGVPLHKHPTAESANKEAKRLAALNKGDSFIVLQSLGEFEVEPVKHTPHVIEEHPF